MPSTDYGSVRVYTYFPEDGPKPKAGDLFETTGGTGYLVADVRPSQRAGHALGGVRVTLVVVNLDDPDLRELPRRFWKWIGEVQPTDR